MQALQGARAAHCELDVPDSEERMRDTFLLQHLHFTEVRDSFARVEDGVAVQQLLL